MLQTQTVEGRTLDLIKTLMRDAELFPFTLVGGTALSLMIGHRKSIDIDLFTTQDFDAHYLATHLSRTYGAEDIKTLNNSLLCFIEEVKVDLIAHKYPVLYPIKVEEGIRMLSLEDIGAMKLNAIYNNGSRLKDFVDIYFLLEKIPLQTITSSFIQKYPDVNIQMAHHSLLYHDDVNKAEKIDYLGKDLSLSQLDVRLRTAVQHPAHVFEKRLQHSLLLQKKVRQNKFRRRPKF